MGIVIIFACVSLLAIYGLYRSLKSKNILGILFACGAAFIFGFFAIMTVINSGYPKLH